MILTSAVWWTAAGGAAAGAVLGLLLRRAGYRRPDEQDRRIVPLPVVGLTATALAVYWGTLLATAGHAGTLLPAAVFGPIGVAVAWIDLDVHRIPNRLNLLAAALMLVALIVTAAVTDNWQTLARAVTVGAVFLGGFALLTLITELGAGDAKFSATVGLALGWSDWQVVVRGLLISLALAALAAVVLLLAGRSRHTHMALGPWLATGAAAALVLP